MPVTGRGGRFGAFAKVYGAEEVIANFVKYNVMTHYYMRGTWAEVGRMVAKEARRLISPGGEMRAYITGDLMRSIKGGAEWRGRMKFAEDRYTVYVGSDCSYAIYVHEGMGRHIGNPRPFFTVAMQRKKGAVTRKLVIAQNQLNRRYATVTKVRTRVA